MACGLVGAGSFFHYAYLPVLNSSDSPVWISGIHTRNEDTFRRAQADLRYRTKYFPTLEALLDSGIQAVLILTPNHLHPELTCKALDRGLHVYCEKPIAPTVAGALELKSGQQRSKRCVMAGFNERYFHRNRVLQTLIAGGLVGKIISAETFHNQNLRPHLKSLDAFQAEITGGGVIHNAGIHLVNLLLHWFGPVEIVRAVFENRALPVRCGEDTAECRFWFASGVKATLAASYVNAVPTTYERIRFVGQDGEIASDFKKCEISGRLKTNQRLKIGCKREIVSDSVLNALVHFEHCIRSGSQPETDVDDSILTMKVIEALTLSAQRRAEVPLEEIERKYTP